jgi:hypothetical protein
MHYRALAHRKHGGERIAALKGELDLVLARGRPGGVHVETFAFADAAEARVIAEILLEAAEQLEPTRARTRCRPARLGRPRGVR